MIEDLAVHGDINVGHVKHGNPAAADIFLHCKIWKERKSVISLHHLNDKFRIADLKDRIQRTVLKRKMLIQRLPVVRIFFPSEKKVLPGYPEAPFLSSMQIQNLQMQQKRSALLPP